MKRRRTHDSTDSNWLPRSIPEFIGMLIAVGLIVTLHIAALSGHSPFDRGINHYGQWAIPGSTWFLVGVTDFTFLLAVYYEIRKRMGARRKRHE